jgi:hypothetical protein
VSVTATSTTSGGATSGGAGEWSKVRTVAMEKVEAELRALWRSAGPGVTRVQTMTIIAVCETVGDADRAHAALAEAAGTHGARTLTVTCDAPASVAARPEGRTTSITAEIALHPSLSKPDRPRGEDIRLHAHGATRAFIPDAIAKLLTPDVPSYVWWVGDIPDDDDLFDHLAPLSGLVLFDSNDMDLRDLATLYALVDRDERYFPGDFAWQRLRTWQELTARFFDDPTCARDVASFDEVVIGFQKRVDPARTPDPISNQAALFGGWIAHALGWTFEKWTRPDALEASFTRKGGRVTMRFEPAKDSTAPSGAITSVSMRVGKGDYHVDRDGKDPMVICWSGTCPGAPVPSQCLRIHPPTPARILAHMLDRPLRDSLFEASLASATKLVSSVAPRPSQAK